MLNSKLGHKSAYIGVDPGSKGYLCLLVPETNLTEWCDFESTPPSFMVDWIKYYQKQYNILKITIEDVHSLHGMSAKSNFMFGYNLGAVTYICRASGIGVDKVAPKVWQKSIGIKPKSPSIKKDIAKICHTIYPKANIFGLRGGLKDGKSDSLMIAHYTFKQLTK